MKIEGQFSGVRYVIRRLGNRDYDVYVGEHGAAGYKSLDKARRRAEQFINMIQQEKVEAAQAHNCGTFDEWLQDDPERARAYLRGEL